MNLALTSFARMGSLAGLLLAIHPNFALADAGVFRQLSGSWRGSGTLTLTEGGQERLSCNGYYNAKGSSGLSVAILCKSPNYNVELRSSLTDEGNGVSGNWEERTFHATGNVSGRAAANRINLSISGAVSGSISISVNGRSQNVSISAAGTGFKRVSISLVRG